MKQRLAGFQKRSAMDKTKTGGLARITYYGDTQARCSCGWGAGHTRTKVLNEKVDQHVEKHHKGAIHL